MYLMNGKVEEEGKQRKVYNNTIVTTRITLVVIKVMVNHISLLTTRYTPAKNANDSATREIPRSGIAQLRA